MEDKISSLDNVIDFREFFYKVFNNWYYFLLSILLSILISYAYVRYSTEYYLVSTKVYVKKDNNNYNSSAADILYKSLNESKKSSIKDEVSMFTSFPLILQTVTDLRFDISYYLAGNIKTSETYISPIKIICEKNVTQNNPNISFVVRVVDNEKYNISCEKLNYENTFKFGKEINIDKYVFTVIKDTNFKHADINPILIRFRGLKQIANIYQSKIEIDKLEKQSNIVTLSLLEEDQQKGIVFLNTLVDNYSNLQKETKKESSLNTVSFIENRIKSIEDSLSLIEKKLQDYKNSHKIPDLDLKTQSIYNKISSLETELSTYKYQDKYYSYLEGYLNDGNSLESLIAPSTYGIKNTTLSELVTQMVNIQLEKNVLIDGGQINNPSISDFDLQLNQLSLNLKEVISNTKKSNDLIIKDLNNRILIEESALSFLPLEQRELLNIERIQKTSETLYMFLLQKKSEAEITASSITSSINHIEPATYIASKPVSPKVYQTYSISLLIGILLPLLILIILDLLDNKIRSRIDLERLTKIELIGLIGRNHSAHTLLSKLNPKSAITEGFRSLRSNLNYKNKSNNHCVYLVTSSISGEGKTFIASNLSVVFANSGMKTILIGADLRKPKLYKDFSTGNDLGLASLLEGSDDINDVIIKSAEPNLDVIISGPSPTNPSDILLSRKFEELIITLRGMYDKIVIDTAPLGLVADAYMVMKYTDVNLFIVRQNYTTKEILRFINGLYKNGRINNLYLVLNDVVSGSGVYGYGKYSYGYGYNYGYNYNSYIGNSEYFDEDET